MNKNPAGHLQKSRLFQKNIFRSPGPGNEISDISPGNHQMNGMEPPPHRINGTGMKHKFLFFGIFSPAIFSR
jgi:hypothetical protein